MRIKLYVLFVTAAIVLVFYVLLATRHSDFTQTRYWYPAAKYLVYSEKCKIPDLDPFNEDVIKFYKPQSYEQCRKFDLLTYTSKNRNDVILHIDERMVSYYSDEAITCCYIGVTRVTDFIINRITHCIEFNSSTPINYDTVIVKCYKTKTKLEVYKNVHAIIKPKNEAQEKGYKAMSVLFIGIDCVSRLNFIRTMPKTYKYLQENDWIEMKGYNKIGDNTFPNLMAILTGLNYSTALKVCDPVVPGKLDACNFIWYDYKKSGYVTAYAEDCADINTFNYLKAGFVNPPTDYYFRPYIITAQTDLKMPRPANTSCMGLEHAGERILNLAKDFVDTFQNRPSFGFFWMNSFSHDDINGPSSMDESVLRFFQDIKKNVRNTMVVFLSDHGTRLGKIRLTQSGTIEERLPFIHISLPEWFKWIYPMRYRNLKMNSNHLCTPFDLYMTLQDILELSGTSYKSNPSKGCPECKSLFEEIEPGRTCEDAHIAPHWCACVPYKHLEPSSDLAKLGAKFITRQIVKLVEKKAEVGKCTKYNFESVISVGATERLMLIKLKTLPAAVFEATGSISRLDYYGDSSYCVSDFVLKKYCSCVELSIYDQLKLNII